MKLSIGCDHTGFALKNSLLKIIQSWGHDVIDQGAYSAESVDFPDIARSVCSSIRSGEAQRGIMICSSGVGAAIACNKVAGIRASCCHDIYTAHQCVEHDDVNVACIGADIVGPRVAQELLQSFLGAQFIDEPDFRRRVQKLAELERMMN